MLPIAGPPKASPETAKENSPGLTGAFIKESLNKGKKPVGQFIYGPQVVILKETLKMGKLTVTEFIITRKVKSIRAAGKMIKNTVKV